MEQSSSPWQDVVGFISKGLDKDPTDRFFLDQQPALVQNKQYREFSVQEPYYTISHQPGETVILKSFVFLAGTKRSITISQHHAQTELPDGIVILTTKRLVLHTRSGLTNKQKELDVPLETVTTTVAQPSTEHALQIMHTSHNLNTDPYLLITTGSQTVKIVPLLFLDAGSKPSTVNKNRGVAGTVQMYSFTRLVSLLQKAADPSPEMRIYYSHDYSLNRSTALGCLLILISLIAVPAITGSMFLSAYLQNGLPVAISTVVFIVLFTISIIYLKRKNEGKYPIKIKPELLQS
ncbi:MAG: hypothetical protein ACOCXQ_02040 [Patescibacteria group bacterium]